MTLFASRAERGGGKIVGAPRLEIGDDDLGLGLRNIEVLCIMATS